MAVPLADFQGRACRPGLGAKFTKGMDKEVNACLVAKPGPVWDPTYLATEVC